MRKLIAILLLSVFTTAVMTGCSSQSNSSSEGVQSESETVAEQIDENTSAAVNAEVSTPAAEDTDTEAEETVVAADAEREGDSDLKLVLTIGSTEFTATIERNSATDELIEKLRESPITISMSDYSGFEKVGSLGFSLRAENRQMTTSTGDIVLYNGNQIVVFYGSNSWSYTKLAHIDNLSGWTEALGHSDVTIEFSIKE